MSFPGAHVHNFTSASILIFLFFFLQMATLSFECLLDSFQSPVTNLGHDDQLQGSPLWGHPLTLPQCTLNMQQVSLTYQKSLVNDSSFQPEGIKPDAYSNTTAILIFLSGEEQQGTEHVHIGLVMCCEGCHLYVQDGILILLKQT